MSSPKMDECFDLLNLENLSYGKFVERQNFSGFFPCFFDIPPSSIHSPYTVVANSLCPLGQALVKALKKAVIPVLDIRGISHLNLDSKAAAHILKEFPISSIFTVCHGNHYLPRLSTLITENRIKVVSTIPFGHADVRVKFPKIFGPRRGKREENIEENWFYQCGREDLTRPRNPDEEIAFANEAANKLVSIAKKINQKQNISKEYSFPLKMYKLGDIHRRMSAVCSDPYLSDPPLNDFILDSIPYQPMERKLTLSLVTTLSPLPRYTQRFQTYLDTMSYYLDNYPPLPFEIIIVYTNKEHPFEKEITIPNNLQKVIRVLQIEEEYVENVKQKYNITYFPEYIMRNIGVRRSRGEFIVTISSDVITNPIAIYDAILNRQFTFFSYFRSPRINIEYCNYMEAARIINTYPIEAKHKVVDIATTNSFQGSLVTRSSGDFQGAHWRMWRRANGYLENDCVFYVDSMLSIDFASQVVPLFVKQFSQAFHLDHEKTSNKTKKFIYYADEVVVGAVSGLPSPEYGFERPNWGNPSLKGIDPVTF